MNTLRKLFNKIFLLVPIPATLIIILLNAGCSTPILRISEFDFRYNNQNYLIRSAYCPDNPESCNQLIGDNFIAVDMNQDRIIDKITKGEIGLSEAQEIYDYCLNLLEKEGKLNEVDRVNNKFVFNDSEYNYQLVSFHPKNNSPFNEITITDKRGGLGYYKVFLLMDNEADGKLDEILKGGIHLEEAQTHYIKIIEEGLASNKLEKTNSYILCK